MPERAIVFLAIAQTFIWASASYIFPALLLWWEQDLGWARTELTGAFTLALLVSAAFSPLVGRIIDKGYGPEMMGLTTVGAGILVGCLAFVQEVWQFYLVWLLIGVMISGCLYEPCFAIITRARGLEAKRSIVAITLLAGFASTISFPLAHELANGFGWRTAVMVFCFIAIVIAAPLMYFGAKTVEDNKTVDESSAKETGNTERSFLKRPEFWFLGLAFALGSHLQQIIIHHLLAILAERNVIRDVAVLAASFIGPMQVAGRIAMVAAEKHASNHMVAILSFTAMGLSAVMLMLSGSGLGFIAGFAIFFGGAHGVVSIVRPMLAWQIMGSDNFGAKSGALASMFFVGGALAPYTGSIIWNLGGYDVVLFYLLMLAIGGLLLYLAAQKFSKN